MHLLTYLTLTLFNPSVLSRFHTIQVGRDGQQFTPSTIKPAINDVVIFHMYPNHNAIQEPFSSPCLPGSAGFYSGSYSDSDSGRKKFVVNLTSTDPVWLYCSVARDCQNGMVGGWNVATTGDYTIAKYAGAAEFVAPASAPNSTRGGQYYDDEQIASMFGEDLKSQSHIGTSTHSCTKSESHRSGSHSATATSTETGVTSSESVSINPSSTGAAEGEQVPDALVVGLGFAAWFL